MNLWNYRGTVKRIIDGDTIEVEVDCGFRIIHNCHLRLKGIDAPEVRGPEREAGLKATDFLETLIPVGSKILFTSAKGKYHSRWVAEIYQATDDWQPVVGAQSINQQLVVAGHAELSAS
jgi:micrococcal nuclease